MYRREGVGINEGEHRKVDKGIVRFEERKEGDFEKGSFFIVDDMEDLTRMRTRILYFLCLCTDEGNERFVEMWKNKGIVGEAFPSYCRACA